MGNSMHLSTSLLESASGYNDWCMVRVLVAPLTHSYAGACGGDAVYSRGWLEAEQTE